MVVVDIRAEIGQILNQPVIDIQAMGGGCVGDVYLAQLADGDKVVAKIDPQKRSGLTVEGRMLRYLTTHTQLPVPGVRFSSDQVLVMDYIAGESRFNELAQHHAAELLAKLHFITAPTFGFEFDTLIGGLPQPNPAYPSWIAFFREQRLVYMAREAARAGRLPQDTLNRVERFGEHVDRWLLEPEKPALIHGDVWTTNVLARGGIIQAFLDPAIYFAHHEIELAFITLFDTFSHAFFQTYQCLRPIAPGFFEERCDIYNLYPLLVHVRLFGGSYVSAVERVLTRFGF